MLDLEDIFGYPDAQPSGSPVVIRAEVAGDEIRLHCPTPELAAAIEAGRERLGTPLVNPPGVGPFGSDGWPAEAVDPKGDAADSTEAPAHGLGSSGATDTTSASHDDLEPAETGGIKFDPPASPWPAAMADFALLLAPDDLPAEPFEFAGPHSVVVNRRTFLRRLQADVRLGPRGPRARYGGVQSDLRRLHELLVGMKVKVDTLLSTADNPVMGKKRIKLSDQVRSAINNCGMSRYRISKETGISEPTLCRFMSGERGLTTKALDTLADFLDLNITMGGKPYGPKRR